MFLLFLLICPEISVNKICTVTKKINILHLSLITQYMFTASLGHQALSKNSRWSRHNHIMETNLMFL